MDEFGLSPATGPPPGYVTPSVVCAEVGVTPTTLAKWRASNRWDLDRDGSAVAVQAAGKFGPTWYYDLERVRLWATTQRPQGVGGARPGSGRKRKSAPPPERDDEPRKKDGVTRAALDAASPLEAAAAEADRKRLRDLADSLSDPTQIPGLVVDGKITRSEAQTLYDLIKHSRGVVALKAERGELVDKAETRREIVEQLGRARTRLTGRENAWADRIMVALGLSIERRAVAQHLARQCLADVLEDLRTAEPTPTALSIAAA